MKVVLERHGSPYLSRRLVKIIYESTGKEYIYTMKELLITGSGIQSIRDTTSYRSISMEGDKYIIETQRYRAIFPSDSEFLSLQEEIPKELKPILPLIGRIAVLGLIARHYDKATVEKVEEERIAVSSEDAA